MTSPYRPGPGEFDRGPINSVGLAAWVDRAIPSGRLPRVGIAADLGEAPNIPDVASYLRTVDAVWSEGWIMLAAEALEGDPDLRAC